jgi:hypothetical protein
MRPHEWTGDGAEQRGDRFVRYEVCKVCGVRRGKAVEKGFLMEDLVEGCDASIVNGVMGS